MNLYSSNRRAIIVITIFLRLHISLYTSSLTATLKLELFTYSIENILHSYGFHTPEKRDALKQLCKQASIIPPGQSWHTVFPHRATPQELMHDILVFAQRTQQAFTIRSGTQERWELPSSSWIDQNLEQNRAYLSLLEFTNAIPAYNNKPDALCILGSTKCSIQRKIDYTHNLIEHGLNPSAIILLAGERYVTKNSSDQEIDGTQEELTTIAHLYNKNNWQQLTETDVFRYVYDQSPLSRKNIPTYIIDTPKHNLPRPTTQTTILELLSWLTDHPEIKHILFMSNQPYVHYQRTVIKSILDEHCLNQKAPITYEIIGSAFDESKTVQSAIEALGSYIWAATPAIISNLHIPITDTETKKLCEILYSKNPLLYNEIRKSYK